MGSHVPVWELWDYLRGSLLPTERMERLLGGPGRLYLSSDTLPAREGPEGSVWGRLVIVPTQTMWRMPSPPHEPRRIGFLIRAEVPHLVQEPEFDPGRLLDAVQQEAFTLLHGHTPPGLFRHLMTAFPVYAWSPPQPAPILDDDRGVFYTSAEYRVEVTSSDGEL